MISSPNISSSFLLGGKKAKDFKGLPSWRGKKVLKQYEKGQARLYKNLFSMFKDFGVSQRQDLSRRGDLERGRIMSSTAGRGLGSTTVLDSLFGAQGERESRERTRITEGVTRQQAGAYQGFLGSQQNILQMLMNMVAQYEGQKPGPSQGFGRQLLPHLAEGLGGIITKATSGAIGGAAGGF